MAGEFIINLSDGNFEVEVLTGDFLAIVDFWAPWCGPCKMIGPIIEEIAKEYQGKVKVGKMNVDENSSVPARYRIRSIPTVMFFKHGQMIKEIIGAVPKSQLVSEIKANI